MISATRKSEFLRAKPLRHNPKICAQLRNIVRSVRLRSFCRRYLQRAFAVLIVIDSQQWQGSRNWQRASDITDRGTNRMAAQSLRDFEILDAFEFNGALAGPSFLGIEKPVEDFIAERADKILALVLDNPKAIEAPYGYRTHTPSGGVIFKANWAALNTIANGMRELGFSSHRKSIETAFSDWPDIAAEISQKRDISRKEADSWGWANALSELALFVVHVVNIYQSEKSLLTNLYATSIREDALGRTNYQPAIDAISKLVKKNLGWKGDCGGSPENRATMLIALIEKDRKTNSPRSNRNGIEYERSCERALRDEGYSVETTPASGDFGADLIAEKDGLRYAIQCKDLSKPVGVKGIQEAVSAKRHYLTDFACVACDAGFTDAAIELATSNKVVVSNLKSLSAQLELAR